MKYRYAGPGPVEDIESGEIIRPGDVREFDEEPAWGPWDEIEPDGDSQDEPGSDEKAPGATETPVQTPAGQSPAPKPENPPATGSAPPAASTGGM